MTPTFSPAANFGIADCSNQNDLLEVETNSSQFEKVSTRNINSFTHNSTCKYKTLMKMKLSLAALFLSSAASSTAAYQVGGFDMFGRPVIVNPRVGRSRPGRCAPSGSNKGCVDRAFEDLANEMNQDRFRGRNRRGRRGPESFMKGIPIDEDKIRQQEEWVNRAFGLATDVAKGMAASPREMKEADEAIRQQKEWVDRFIGVAKDVSSGGMYSSVSSEVLRDDDQMFEVALDFPGVKESDVEVTVEGSNAQDRILVVQGKRKVGNEEFKKFSKVFALDSSSEIEKISATLENGVLVVSAPRDSAEKAKASLKIPVKQNSIEYELPSEADNQAQPYQLILDLPGVKVSDIDIVVEGESEKTLIVTAVRNLGKDSDGNPRTKEISKSFNIDSLVDTATIEANLDSGVLTISATKDKKKEEESVRKIEVKSSQEVGENKSQASKEKDVDGPAAGDDSAEEQDDVGGD